MSTQNYRDTPVLLIGYSRIDKLKLLIEKLRKLEVKEVYVALDFSVRPEITASQSELIREVEYTAGSFATKIIFWRRTRNHGVGVAIVSALDWFFEKNDHGIIIEDDLIFDLPFLEFCTEALVEYTNSNDVWMVSGDRFDLSNSPTVVATNYPQIWGWASWRSKWKEIRAAILKEKKNQNISLMNLPSIFFLAGALRVEVGIVDTWDLPLAYEMYSQKKMCVLPPVNLVSNIGTDDYATHTTHNRFPINYPIRELNEFKLPSVKELKDASRTTNRFLENEIFRIRKRHYFSLAKCYWDINWRNRNIGESQSFKARLEKAERFHG
jgi:hypothetical protein